MRTSEMKTGKTPGRNKMRLRRSSPGHNQGPNATAGPKSAHTQSPPDPVTTRLSRSHNQPASPIHRRDDLAGERE